MFVVVDHVTTTNILLYLYFIPIHPVVDPAKLWPMLEQPQSKALMRCSYYGDVAAALHMREHKKTKRKTENSLDFTPVPVDATSESSLLSNIIYGLGEINIKNRKGKTTARTIKKLVVKVRAVRGGTAPPAAGGNPSVARLPPALKPPRTKGLGQLTLARYVST